MREVVVEIQPTYGRYSLVATVQVLCGVFLDLEVAADTF